MIRDEAGVHDARRLDLEVEVDVSELLHSRGERMTGPRRAVVRALAGQAGHCSAEDVVQAVAGLDEAVHRASVYRTLEAFSALGVVQHVHVGHGAPAYHLLRSRPPHLHASCRTCGVVRDLPVGRLHAVVERVATQDDFHLDLTHVALSETCGDCRRAEGAT